MLTNLTFVSSRKTGTEVNGKHLEAVLQLLLVKENENS